jgi:hypothetical protein
MRPRGLLYAVALVLVDGVLDLVDQILGLVLCVLQELLGLAGRLIGLPVLLQLLVTGEISDGLLDPARGLIGVDVRGGLLLVVGSGDYRRARRRPLSVSGAV